VYSTIGTMVFCTYCGQQFQRKEHLERHLTSRKPIQRESDRRHVLTRRRYQYQALQVLTLSCVICSWVRQAFLMPVVYSILMHCFQRRAPEASHCPWRRRHRNQPCVEHSTKTSYPERMPTMCQNESEMRCRDSLHALPPSSDGLR
jgi:hypothetical protein